ncbi:ferrochelatase [Pontibacter sp. E15-1]|nr:MULTISPECIES: ferrochelatase [Hymenobacteraceae]MCJ8165969.1 ferrochelatase [Pontibacter sp. E15-1]
MGNDPWLKPFTDDVLKELPAQGKRMYWFLVPRLLQIT